MCYMSRILRGVRCVFDMTNMSVQQLITRQCNHRLLGYSVARWWSVAKECSERDIGDFCWDFILVWVALVLSHGMTNQHWLRHGANYPIGRCNNLDNSTSATNMLIWDGFVRRLWFYGWRHLTILGNEFDCMQEKTCHFAHSYGDIKFPCRYHHSQIYWTY